MAIASFADSATKMFFETGKVARGVGWGGVKNVVQRKLDMVHYAHILADLKSPPGNRLEALAGRLRGYHSIRINDQWRVVFKWGASGPEEVQVCDYH